MFLIIATGVTIYKFVGPGARDMKAAKKFMSKLYSINAINKEQNLWDIKYERVKILNSQNKLVHRTILTQAFGIDLDEDNNVIGFAKKDIPPNNAKINIEKAETIAEEYLKNIYDSEIVLKAKKEDDTLPYYSFVFTKEKDGHPFYFDEIKVNINKDNGFLDGYANTAMQIQYKESKINISKEDAEDIAIEIFERYNKDGKSKNEMQLVYTNNKLEKNSNRVAELCYMLTVEGKDTNGSNISWKIFINANDGTMFAILKDGVEKEVTTS